jgi:hypothetical protein
MTKKQQLKRLEETIAELDCQCIPSTSEYRNIDSSISLIFRNGTNRFCAKHFYQNRGFSSSMPHFKNYSTGELLKIATEAIDRHMQALLDIGAI